ncbi:MAG: phage major capsid protein, partial [Bacteroidales bacterium]
NSMKTSIFRTLLKLKKEERLTAEELETKSIGDKIAEDAGIIHLLRDRMGLILPIALRSLIPGGTFGSEVLPGATNVFANSIINRLPYIPYQAKSGGTIAAVSESIAGFYDQNDEADDAAMTLATITHSPKRITAFIPFSAQLRMQSPEMQDQVLLKNLQRACSAALDRSVFGVGERSATVMQGVGYATRYGILSRINSISPNWNRIMELEETLMAANALPDGYFWITNPRGARRLKQTEIETGFPKVILEKGLIDNIPVLISSSVSNEGAIEGDADLLIMGNWNDLALIIYGGISFTLDDISRMRESIQTIIVDIFVDCKGLRAPLATSDDGSTQTNDYSSSFGVIPIAPSIGNQS